MGISREMINNAIKRLTKREDVSPRDYSISIRLKNLAFDADQHRIVIDSESLDAFIDYLISHPEEKIPQITISRDRKIQAAWKEWRVIDFQDRRWMITNWAREDT